MEFLMTYGWAVLVVLTVLAVLFYAGVFNTGNTVPTSCTLPAGFTCNEFRVDDYGNMYLDLGQATGKAITVTGIGCGSSSNPTVWPANVPISNGGHANVTGAGIPCSEVQAGTFKGTILLTYSMAGSSLPRTARGTVSAPVQYGNALSLSGPGWNSSFQYVRPIILNTGVSSNLTDFPAYFTLDTASLITAGKMNSSCKDVRLATSDNQTMDFEIEANTCSTATTVIWARIPQTNANQNYYAYLYYGNATVADGQNKTGVWKNGYAAIYHLSGVSDSLGGSNPTNNGAVQIDGIRGKAYSFDGVSQLISLGNAASLRINNNLTITAWAKTAGSGNEAYIVGSEWGQANRNYQLCLNRKTMYFVHGNGTVADHPDSSLDIGDDSWHFVALVANGTNAKFFKDTDSETKPLAFPVIEPATENKDIGGMSGYPVTMFNGSIDEVRISGSTRSSDWIAAEYGQTYSVGSERSNQ